MIPFLTRPFRRRLTLAFVLVAVVSAGTLSVAALLSIRAYRLRTFRAHAADETELMLRLLPSRPDAGRLEELLAVSRTRSNLDTVAIVGSEIVASNPTLTADRVPRRLLEVRAGDTETARTTVAGKRYFVVAVQNQSAIRLFVFFSTAEVDESLQQAAVILLLTALGVTVVGSVAGTWVARRTLVPVRRASIAARALVEELADISVPRLTDDEFGTWVESFNSVTTALAERIKELSAVRDRERAFTSDVAHELRTPVTSLITAVSILEEDVDLVAVPQRRTIELMGREARRLRQLLDEIMELSRLDAGAIEIVIETVELGSLVSAIIRDAGLTEAVQLDAECVPVETDRRRVERIVANLITNADHHARRGIEVAVHDHGLDAEVIVRDRGPGIPPEHLDRIFDRFYQVDSSRTGTSSGVGLAIAAENARAIGARLTASNRADGGCEFRLALPVCSQDAARSPKPTVPSASSAASDPVSAEPASG